MSLSIVVLGLTSFLSPLPQLTSQAIFGQSAQQFDVTKFGAKGDDRADDTPAIQAAFDAARNAGGGKIYFPRGTYLVRPSTDTVFTVPNNIEVAGAGPSSIIKLPNGAGKYNAIFYAAYGSVNLSFHDFRVDQNPTGNTATPVGEGNFASVIHVNNFKNLRVQRVRFEPACGVWAIVGLGAKGNQLLVEDCIFDFVNGRVGKKGAEKVYDVSVIYAQGNRQRIQNSVFKTKLFEYGVTAIEIQGGDILIRKNKVDYFNCGVLVTNSLPGKASQSDPVVIESNQFLHVQTGVDLWASTKKVLRNVKITHNEITLAARGEVAWAPLYHGISHMLYTGLTTEADPDTYRGDVSDILVANNTITFLDVPPEYHSNQGQITGGINFDSVGNAKNVQIVDNKIIDSPLVGIHLGNSETNNTLVNIKVENNEIINPGWSGAAKPEYRAAVRLAGQLNGVQVMNNKIKRTPSRGRMRGIHAFWGHPKSAKNVVLKNNSVDAQDEIVSDLDPAISVEK